MAGIFATLAAFAGVIAAALIVIGLAVDLNYFGSNPLYGYTPAEFVVYGMVAGLVAIGLTILESRT